MRTVSDAATETDDRAACSIDTEDTTAVDEDTEDAAALSPSVSSGAGMGICAHRKQKGTPVCTQRNPRSPQVLLPSYVVHASMGQVGAEDVETTMGGEKATLEEAAERSSSHRMQGAVGN